MKFAQSRVGLVTKRKPQEKLDANQKKNSMLCYTTREFWASSLHILRILLSWGRYSCHVFSLRILRILLCMRPHATYSLYVFYVFFSLWGLFSMYSTYSSLLGPPLHVFYVFFSHGASCHVFFLRIVGILLSMGPHATYSFYIFYVFSLHILRTVAVSFPTWRTSLLPTKTWHTQSQSICQFPNQTWTHLRNIRDREQHLNKITPYRIHQNRYKIVNYSLDSIDLIVLTVLIV